VFAKRYADFLHNVNTDAMVISKKIVIVFSLILLICTAYFGFKKHSHAGMKAMNCKKLLPEEYTKRLSARLAMPIYKPKSDAPHFPVTFKFNLSPDAMKDSILIIKSSKVSADVYQGPYSQELVIKVGDDLLRDGGGDNLQIRIFNNQTKTSCTSVHESEPFWQANKKVIMEFLDERELNELGLPVTFKVRIE
jgi:hypothetical protein